MTPKLLLSAAVGASSSTREPIRPASFAVDIIVSIGGRETFRRHREWPFMTGFWTNPSVLALAGDGDPEVEVTKRARQAVFAAIEEGWKGPPFDPFELAQIRGIPVVARDDIYDARVVPIGRGNHVRIEYNPNRPVARQRYSLSHELAHTLFDDVADDVRYRSRPSVATDDSWQLELLCNVAAAEMLMPTGAFPELRTEPVSIEHVLELRQQFAVSTEAVLLRIAKLTGRVLSVFAASRVDGDRLNSRLRIEYVHGSRAWQPRVRRGLRLPRDTVLSHITAVGFTAKGTEDWASGLRGVGVEGVGLPPYPNQTAPRVAGILWDAEEQAEAALRSIEFVRGDATEPRGEGPKIIAHVVNDKTSNWGGAFARQLRAKFPVAQDEFRDWASNPAHLQLGETHLTRVADDITIASMVAQHGYGSSTKPRIRYEALQTCLRAVLRGSLDEHASVHMPRVGAGQAGGRWPVIQAMIESEILDKDVDVVVYSIPGDSWLQEPTQTSLAV